MRSTSFAAIFRGMARQDTLDIPEGPADVHALTVDCEIPDVLVMARGAHLEDGKRQVAVLVAGQRFGMSDIEPRIRTQNLSHKASIGRIVFDQENAELRHR